MTKARVAPSFHWFRSRDNEIVRRHTTVKIVVFCSPTPETVRVAVDQGEITRRHRNDAAEMLSVCCPSGTIKQNKIFASLWWDLIDITCKNIYWFARTLHAADRPADSRTSFGRLQGANDVVKNETIKRPTTQSLDVTNVK